MALLGWIIIRLLTHGTAFLRVVATLAASLALVLRVIPRMLTVFAAGPCVVLGALARARVSVPAVTHAGATIAAWIGMPLAPRNRR